MNFRVGQRVVCVDGDPGDDQGIFPTEGAIYTVAWIGECDHPLVGRYIGVHLLEINRPPSLILQRVVAYWAKRFRPVIERKTDISIFTAMLTPSPERVSKQAIMRLADS